MTKESAKIQISKAVNDYDEGRITGQSLNTIISETIDQVAEEFYAAGADTLVPDEYDDEIEFEADFDLDDFKDDDDTQ